jgi:hypothetical protein
MIRLILAVISALIVLTLAYEPQANAQVTCPNGKLAKTKADCGPATTKLKQGKTDQKAAPHFKMLPIDNFTSDQGRDEPKPKPKPKPKEDCMSCAN